MISYKTAKLAKEVGYVKKESYYYNRNGTLGGDYYTNPYTAPNHLSCPAPTQEVLHKWVREHKNVLISIYRNASGFLWSMSTADGGTDLGWCESGGEYRGDCESSGTFTTYEKAYEDALYLSLLGDVVNYRNNGSHYSGYVEYLFILEKLT